MDNGGLNLCPCPSPGGWFYSRKKRTLYLSPRLSGLLKMTSQVSREKILHSMSATERHRLEGHFQSAYRKKSSFDLMIGLESPSLSLRLKGKCYNSDILAGYAQPLPSPGERSWQQDYIEGRGDCLLMIWPDRRVEILQKGKLEILPMDILFPQRLEGLIPPELLKTMDEKIELNKKKNVFSYNLKYNRLQGKPVLRFTHRKLTQGRQLISIEDISPFWQATEQRRYHNSVDLMNQLNSGMAHRFNNNLMGIQGTLDLWKSILTNPREQSYWDRIEHFIQDSQDLLQRFIGHGQREEYTWKELDLESLLLDLVAEYRNYPLDPLHINLRVSCQSCHIRGDREKIILCLRELITNGLESMTPQGGVLDINLGFQKIESQRSDFIVKGCNPGNYLYLDIQDSGRGMTKTEQKRIFDPFYTTKEQEEGRGMGLSLVLGTLYGHHGTLTVKSKPGHGSRFRIYLPLVHCEEKISPSRKPLEPSRTSKTLMLVDDQWYLLEILQEILEQEGYHCYCFGDSREALRFYREHHDRVDLSILDMMMPHLNGKELFMEMRRAAPHSRALMLSGFIHEELGQELGELGFLEILKKPMDKAALLAALNRHITGQEKESDLPIEDLELAQHRLGNELPLYLKLLNRFQSHFSTAFQELVSFIENQDYTRAYPRAHQLKNQCNLLGLFPQADALLQLERALSDKNYQAERIGGIHRRITPLLEEIPRVLLEIERYYSKSDAQEKQQALLDKLFQEAELHNLSECKETMEYINQQNSFSKEILEKLNDQLESMDFTGLVQSISKLRSTVW